MTSPELRGRHVATLSGLGCLLAVAMNLPLAANLGKVPAADPVDRLYQSWQLAWNGHALLNRPFEFLDANAFWPLENSAAFSDALFGFTPAGLAGSGPVAAIVRYNLVFLFTYAAALAAAALLGRELGLRWPAAVLTGAAFAFAPFRLAHHNHLNVLGSFAIPLCLFLLLRGYRRGRPRMVFAGFLAAAWQVAIGFTLGIQLAYLLGALALIACFWWWRSVPRTRIEPAMAWATAGGVAVLIGWGLLQALPYFRVIEEHPEARRTIEAVRFYSPPPEAFLAAPPDSLVWGRLTEPFRQGLAWPPEMALFPGATVLVLALVGVALPSRRSALRWGLALAALLTGLLATGYSLAGGRFLYGLLYQLAPGWQSSRTPGRIFTLTSLALALLAGVGVQALVRPRSSAHKSGARRGGFALLGIVLPALLVAAVLVEGLGTTTPDDLVSPPVRALPLQEPQLHLPSNEHNDPLYLFWSVRGFPDVVNGYGAFTPAYLSRLRAQVAGFPDRPSVERLRALGVRLVILHPERSAGTPWEDAASKATDDLPLNRTLREGSVVFELHPAEESAG